MDDNHSMSLDKFEFSKAMSDYMLGFSEGEVQTLFAFVDYDRSGPIEYEDCFGATELTDPIVRKAIEILNESPRSLSLFHKMPRALR